MEISNAQIVTPEGIVNGGMVIEDAVIASIGKESNVGAIDFGQDFLIPGLIDIHTDNLEKHFFPRENVDWDPVSAAVIHDTQCASAGITTVYDSLSVGSWSGNEARQVENMSRLIGGLLSAVDRDMLRVDHRLHWRCETTNPFLKDLFEVLGAHPLTGLLSVMDHTPGQRQYPDLEKHMKRWRDHLGMSDEEMQAKYKSMVENQITHSPLNRAYISEKSLERDLPLASHDDETIEHVLEAYELKATISEFPTTMTAAQKAKDCNMFVVMGAPNLMRGGSYSGNVSAGEVAQEGLLDSFASDYVPRSMIEAAFKLMEAPYNWSPEAAIATVTSKAADSVGLTDRGRIEEGKRADLVRVSVIDGRPIVRSVWTNGNRVI